MNKLVAGIGIYEKGRYAGSTNGNVQTKLYRLWLNMLNRCKPGGVVQDNQPAYVGCSVHSDFIKFQDFAEWCQHQIGFGHDGWALDKDILVPGNKVYGPDTCVFVPRQLNLLLTHKRSNKGEYPTGVCYDKSIGKFKATIAIDSKSTYIGIYTTIEDAHEAYKVAKLAEIHRQAEIWKDRIDRRVYEALRAYTFD